MIVFRPSLAFVTCILAVLSLCSAQAETVDVPLQEGNLHLPAGVDWAVIVPPVSDAQMADLVTKAHYDADPVAATEVLRRRVEGKPSLVLLGDQPPFDQTRVSSRHFQIPYTGGREAFERAFSYLGGKRYSEYPDASYAVFVYSVLVPSIDQFNSTSRYLDVSVYQNFGDGQDLENKPRRIQNPFVSSNGDAPTLRFPPFEEKDNPVAIEGKYYTWDEGNTTNLDIVIPFQGEVIAHDQLLMRCDYWSHRAFVRGCAFKLQRNPSRISADFRASCPCRSTLAEIRQVDRVISDAFSDFLE